MNKSKAKHWLHIVGLCLAVVAAIYVGAVQKGPTITERIGIIGALAAALLTALGQVMPRVDKAIDGLPDDEPARDKQAGSVTASVAVVMFWVAAVFGMLWAFPLRAEPWQTVSPGVYKSGVWTAHPNFALSAGQVNVKSALTDGLTSGAALERVALMGGYGMTYHGDKITLGAALYAGTGISAKTPNAPQVNLLLTLWDVVALGPGVQRVTYASGVVAYQMLFTLGLNYSAGGTVSKVAPWFDKLLSACTSAAACGI
jgi:hypothetical protein